jgi:hypothetical protein
MGYVTHYADSAAPTNRVRVGVGGRWSPEELGRFLATLSQLTCWSVRTRGDHALETSVQPNFKTIPYGDKGEGVIEIVFLGDGLSSDAPIADDEELDAVVISPLAASAASEAIDRTQTARKSLARFVRQLRPGGATIFAADDPASDIFSAIRLDCQRVGYGFDGTARRWRVDRIDARYPKDANQLRLSIADDIMIVGADRSAADNARLTLAAVVTIEVLGLAKPARAASLMAILPGNASTVA